MILFRKQYICMFVVSEQGTYNLLKKRRFSPSNNKLRFKKGNAHVIDVSIPTFEKGLKLFFFVDINKGQIFFDKSRTSVNPELVDMVLKQGIIKQLTVSLAERSWGGRIMDIILGAGIGALIGYIVGSLI